jgi:hypothetical protein
MKQKILEYLRENTPPTDRSMPTAFWVGLFLLGLAIGWLVT